MNKKFLCSLLATTVSICLLGGCSQSNSNVNDSEVQAPEVSDTSAPSEKMHLKLAMAGTDIKAACIIIAEHQGYFEEEGVDIEFEKVSNLAEALTAVSLDKVDVLPFGVIPSCSFISKGTDVVIIGGTISEGSEAIVTKENKDRFKEFKDFVGAKVGCFRMETGHMVMRGLLREAGIDVNKDVEFVYLDSQASILQAVEKGEVDIGFVNSGYGYIAKQSDVEVAFATGDFKKDFPCCRQTTSRNCIKNKRDALVALEVANLRAYKLYKEDADTTVSALAEYSGQDEEYVRNVIYGSDSYHNAMVISLDPNKKRVSDFYDVMKVNEDIDKDTPYDINDNIDVTIYEDALKILMEREPDCDIYKQLYDEFKENNF